MTSQAATRPKSASRTIRAGTAIVLVPLCAFGLTIYQANAATDPLATEAFITGAMSIDCSAQGLDFGLVVASGAIGTVTVSTAGVATDGGGATYSTGAAAGECILQGNASALYDIDYVVSDLTGPGANMTLTALVSDNANGDGPFNGVGPHAASLDAGGADVLSFGGTLNVGANQVVGDYTGTIDVTVDYP